MRLGHHLLPDVAHDRPLDPGDLAADEPGQRVVSPGADRPAVLFLDEPTTGLDPGSRAALWDLVRRLRDDFGTTVVLTTHYLDEADALADRLIVIDREWSWPTARRPS